VFVWFLIKYSTRNLQNRPLHSSSEFGPETWPYPMLGVLLSEPLLFFAFLFFLGGGEGDGNGLGFR
jgi:hypothetical protein